jgi:hypothetical protein
MAGCVTQPLLHPLHHQELNALWERWSEAVAVKKPTFLQRLARAERNVAAVSVLLQQVAQMLRRLVQVFGWLVLLYWTARLPFRPDLSVAHLVLTPGGGLLAVVQGIVKRPSWTKRANAVADALESEPAVSGELADMGRLIEDASRPTIPGFTPP